jgi:hypothetical protein
LFSDYWASIDFTRRAASGRLPRLKSLMIKAPTKSGVYSNLPQGCELPMLCGVFGSSVAKGSNADAER